MNKKVSDNTLHLYTLGSGAVGVKNVLFGSWLLEYFNQIDHTHIPKNLHRYAYHLLPYHQHHPLYHLYNHLMIQTHNNLHITNLHIRYYF